MRITMIHGQSHKGSTYKLAWSLAEKLGGEVTEFFLPRDFDKFCTGCTACIVKDEKLCPHYEKLLPLTRAMDEADVLILASPVYVYHVTGSMKAFLDHYGYRWMVHRPEKSMFRKQAVCISTAAGGGMKAANQDMADSMYYWGVAKIWKYGKAVGHLSAGAAEKMDRDMEKLAKKILACQGRVKPGIRTRAFFEIMRKVQMKKPSNGADSIYWKEKGWFGKERPWKRN